MPVLAVAGWSGALLGLLAGPWLLGAVVLVALAAALARRSRVGVALVLVLAGVGIGALLRETQTARSPVAELAAERAAASLALTVTSDPRPVSGRYGDQILLRATVREMTARGVTESLGTRVLVLGDDSWRDVALGSTVRTTAVLAPADGHGVAALVSARGDPVVLAEPDVWWRGADAVRASLRASVAERPPSQAALVPALVAGDDGGLDPELAEDFRTSGLTHLLAVSGTNLTLVVGFLLVVARWLGARGRWLLGVAALGIVGFVLLARTEPSVVRAAAMGTVALVSLGTDGRRRGPRTLGVAVVGLLLVDPLLAMTAGFALSVVATAGIVMLAPGWRDALGRWLPRWAAEAVSVPATAQLACTPIVAAISGQVSLVAVATNLVVAPVVGPATVLGLAGGLTGLVVPPVGEALGSLAGWCVAWVVMVARFGADLPTPTLDWATGPFSLGLLTVLVVAIALLGPRLLQRPLPGIGSAALLAAVVLLRPPSPGWPGTGWVLAACDVGQGDALVLHSGPGAGVVVDAGPDPAAVDRCLARLDVAQVPLVVLTHFHADHVDGLTGVLDGRAVGAVEMTTLAEPPDGAAHVVAEARAAGVQTATAVLGRTRRVGDVTIQVLWPGPGPPSEPNDASVVLLVEVAGLRILLPGDLEPPGQAALARLWPGLRVDVLKVPHHGSRFQDLPWLTGLGARVALVSAGRDNDYGHPAGETLAALEGAGMRVLRTDTDGDLLVLVEDGRVTTDTGGGL